MQKRLYFKNLDASRFFAFLLVLLAHCFIAVDNDLAKNQLFFSVYTWGKMGVLGLEYFFVLSSFLISTIILEEIDQNGSFDLSNFLIRRSLRVWPLYFLILALGFLIAATGNILDVPVSELPPLPYLVFFVVNFYIIQYGTDFLFFIAFLWSISIEEQFYLLWSLFLKFIPFRFEQFCLLLVSVSLIFRFIYLDQDATLYFHTVSTLGNFGIGGLLAWGLKERKNFIINVVNLGKISCYAIYALIILLVICYHQAMDFRWFRWSARLIYSVLFSFVILNQARGKFIPFELGRIKAFDYLGKISYGLYCYHGVVITLLVVVIRTFDIHENLATAFLLWPVVIFGLTVLLSHLSYRFFESHFLKLKSRFYSFRP
ncbi:MAG: acyltransferase [Vicingaceae bacterium]